MKNSTLISLFLLIVISVNAQSTKIWLTINDNVEIEIIKSNFDITKVKKALPASQRSNLQKVYEVEINGDYSSFIGYINESKKLSKPEIIEDFALLYEPNDYNLMFAEDYALDLINAQEAWGITRGAPAIKIAVLDSNFDSLHEELADKVSYMAPDIYGIHFNHGTAVATTAAGNTNNGVGKSAIGNKCELMLYGMNYNHLLQATYSGARVINISWSSGCYFNSYYQDVIDEVYNNGSVIIASAGNGGTCGGAENYVYPASFEHVISVSSIGPNNNHQRFLEEEMSTHQHNDSVDLVAPGYDVALTIANNIYTTGNGTSFASPYVAGTVGLMLSINPCISPAEVEMILKSTAVSVDNENPLYIGRLGAGRLDAHAAVEMAKEMIPIDFDVLLNESTCTNGVSNIAIHLNEGDVNAHNLQWSDGSNDWTINNPSAGTFNFTLSSPDGCSINQDVTFEPNGPHFDYPNSLFITDESFTLADSNNDGVINVRGSIVVENNVDYNLSDLNVSFTDNSDLSSLYPNSGIVVKEGANLIIEDVYLSSVNECSNTWDGIELWSESGEIARVSIDNSTIENAKIAVSNISKHNFNNDLQMEGGQIKLTNSTIVNARIGVNIVETVGHHSSHIIKTSSFLNTDNILDPTYIALNGVQNISIAENIFKGNVSLQPEARGTAVDALNSDLNRVMVKPHFEETSFSNTYTDLYIGIKLSNSSKGLLTAKVYNEFFNNVRKSIRIEGEYKGEIALNEFNVPAGSSQIDAFGIKTNGDNQLKIVENIFFGIVSINNYGLISESNKVGEGLIKLNRFEGEFVNAINFIGANSFDEVSCNDFNIHGQYDWFIYKSENGELGSLNVNEELNINQFSDTVNVVYNLKNHHDNSLFHYQDISEFMPKTVCESITLDDLQIEITKDNFCYNRNYDIINRSESLSLDENEMEESVSVYPNPSNGVIHISNDVELKIEQVQIMNIAGKIIETIEWNQQKAIDLSSYSAGTYVIGFELGGSVKTERVVIL